MTQSALLRFILLGAIWGSSFLFMRIISPVIGGFWTADLRLLIGALTLLVLMRLRGLPLNLHHWRHYVVTGLFNCALPFTLFGIAGRLIPAGYSAVLNSTVPLWVALLGVWLLKDSLSVQGIVALVLGLFGVILVALPAGEIAWTAVFVGGLIACLIAAVSYALAMIYVRTRTVGVLPQAMATMSQLFGSLMVLPFALMFSPAIGDITAPVVLSTILLGAVCSGFAFWIFYQLIGEIGPLMTSSVTFLVPLFGIFWAWLILDESLGWHVFAGCALIISGAVLLYRSNFQKQKARA
jgi:drug/metabolite transporter (DMT)-like permease